MRSFLLNISLLIFLFGVIGKLAFYFWHRSNTISLLKDEIDRNRKGFTENSIKFNNIGRDGKFTDGPANYVTYALDLCIQSKCFSVSSRSVFAKLLGIQNMLKQCKELQSHLNTCSNDPNCITKPGTHMYVISDLLLRAAYLCDEIAIEKFGLENYFTGDKIMQDDDNANFKVEPNGDHAEITKEKK